MESRLSLSLWDTLWEEYLIAICAAIFRISFKWVVFSHLIYGAFLGVFLGIDPRRIWQAQARIAGIAQERSRKRIPTTLAVCLFGID